MICYIWTFEAASFLLWDSHVYHYWVYLSIAEIQYSDDITPN